MNRLVTSVLALVAALSSVAAPRTVNEAQDLASQFMNSRQSALRLATHPTEMTLAHTEMMRNDEPAFYVFNSGNGGFILVSADDNTREILGYSEESAFDANNIPTNMRRWFLHYSEEIAYAAKAPDKPERAKLPAAIRTVTPIQPLLGGIQWNQGTPYNDMCPIDQTDDTRCYTGCVATAAAQIMRYWKHPKRGTGEHTNDWENDGYGYGSEYANFGETTYDWNNMLEKYKTNKYDEEEAQAVATLMYHVGISCDMIYGGNKVGGSGAFTYKIMQALYTYFKYDQGCEYLLKDAIGLKSFEKRFMEEIKAGRPILMGGGTIHNEGHEFVCDGIDKDGYWHINWGWGGSSDGYFALSALDPDEQGAGGAASGEGFSVEVEAVVGIQPDKGNSMGAPCVVVDKYNTNKDNYSFNGTEFSKNESITFYTDYGYSYGPADVENAELRLGVFDLDSTFVKACGADRLTIPAFSQYYTSIQCSAALSGVSKGDYLLAVVFRTSSDQDFKPIPIIGVGEFFNVQITNSKVIIGGPASNPEDPDPEDPDPKDPDEVITLEVNDSWARYDKSNEKGPWTLVVRDYTDKSPWVQFYFKSGYKNCISGTYDLADGHMTYWPDVNNEEVQFKAKTGTLRIRCIRKETDEEFGKYRIKAEFTCNDSKSYKLNALLEVPAYDKYDDYIVLKDPEEEDAIESVEHSEISSMKVLENGVIVIKKDDKKYTILGTPIQ